MRISTSMMSTTITRNLMRQSEALYKVQEQITTQKKINRPSDDPIGMRKVLDYRNKIGDVDQYLNNIRRGISRLELTEITLDAVDDLIAVAREIAQQQADGTTQSRQNAADQVRDLANQVAELANTKTGKNHIFSGHKTDLPAFGHVVEVSGGTAGVLEFGLAADATNVTLEVRDENGTVINTIIPGGGGTEGVNSVAWSGGVPADGIYRFSVTASNAGGDVVDYTTYNGDNGTVQIMIGENTELTLKADGREVFTPAGQVDTFEVFADLIAALEADDVAAISSLSQSLGEAQVQIGEFRAAGSPKIFQLENTENYWYNFKPKLEQLLSKTEDIDQNEAAMRFNQIDLAYQSTIASAARVMQPSLVNFLK